LPLVLFVNLGYNSNQIILRIEKPTS
jgi:hypothetical protein